MERNTREMFLTMKRDISGVNNLYSSFSLFRQNCRCQNKGSEPCIFLLPTIFKIHKGNSVESSLLVCALNFARAGQNANYLEYWRDDVCL